MFDIWTKWKVVCQPAGCTRPCFLVVCVCMLQLRSRTPLSNFLQASCLYKVNKRAFSLFSRNDPFHRFDLDKCRETEPIKSIYNQASEYSLVRQARLGTKTEWPTSLMINEDRITKWAEHVVRSNFVSQFIHNCYYLIFLLRIIKEQHMIL